MIRSAGVLLHPTSLPGGHGIGDFGASAYRFVDWLARGQDAPLASAAVSPSGGGQFTLFFVVGDGDEPSVDRPGWLAALGLLSVLPDERPGRVDYAYVTREKLPLVRAAASRLVSDRSQAGELLQFREQNPWVNSFALFLALKEAHAGQPWWEWPLPERRRDARALSAAEEKYTAAITTTVAEQFICARQWRRLRSYAGERGIEVIGDLPIYVDGDSVDVWAHQQQFELAEDGRPLEVAGVPPDYFSATGQLWGNPLYRWEVMAKDGFSWWRARLARALEQVSLVRIDHFRAFASYWAVPAGAADARAGRWREGPGEAFFAAMKELHPVGNPNTPLPIIAEDLGIIDDEVRRLRQAVGLPGMSVLQFAFSDFWAGHDAAKNVFLPHHHVPHSVVYTGTHDNDTTLGWWQAASEGLRDHVRRYLSVSGHDIGFDLIRAALSSVGETALVPAQDLLSLGSDARQNIPSVSHGNWCWRLAEGQLGESLAQRIAELNLLYSRTL